MEAKIGQTWYQLYCVHHKSVQLPLHSTSSLSLTVSKPHPHSLCKIMLFNWTPKLQSFKCIPLCVSEHYFNNCVS